jgi:hypothetical protein
MAGKLRSLFNFQHNDGMKEVIERQGKGEEEEKDSLQNLRQKKTRDEQRERK